MQRYISSLKLYITSHRKYCKERDEWNKHKTTYQIPKPEISVKIMNKELNKLTDDLK